MLRVLYVEASPRKQRSASIEVARAFLDDLNAVTGVTIDTLDLWATQLPEFDGSALAAKYAGLSGVALTPDQRAAWAEISRLVDRFRTADLLVFALPLWNFGLPYKMKHLIDVVSHKDLLFSFDERGLNGLLAGKRAVVIYARGLDYAPASDTPAGTYDFQRPYMELWLKFIGISDIESVTVEKTLLGPEADQGSRDKGRREAGQLARRLASMATRDS
jgi:FMN-dependent NADH-azoreductase